MATFLIHLLYIATISQSLTVSDGNQAPVSCEVCDVTDSDCVKGGSRTVCDVTQQYCLTEVTDTLAGDRTVGRKCVDITECEKKFAVTEERLFCYEVDMGNLRADVTCSFCCRGDLCNQGPHLIPQAQFLYNGDLNVTGFSTPSVSPSKTSVMTSSIIDSSTRGLSTVPVVSDMCEVCDVTDPDCFHGGTPTSCDEDHSFCMTTVHDNFPNNMTVRRSCVNESVCYQKWYMETSWRHYCYDIDQGELYFPVDCNFCCVGDLCNAGPTLVPSPETLYQPKVVPTVSGTTSSSVVISEGSSTTSKGMTVPSQSYPTIDGLTESIPPSTQEFSTDSPSKASTDGSTSPTSPNTQGLSSGYFTGSTPSSPQGSSTGGLTGPTSQNPQESSTGGLTGPTPTGPLSSSVDGLTGPTSSGPQGSSTDYVTGPTSSGPHGTSTDYVTGSTSSGPHGTSTDYVTGSTSSGPQGPSTDYVTGPTPSGSQESTSDGSTSPEGSSPGGSIATYVTQPTTVSTTEKHTICEVCDESDPECFTSGTPARCDLEESYCMTTVHDNYPSNMTVSRGCVNESVCYQKWYMETSWRHYCYDVDQGELYFPVDCNFCCVGDLCNSGVLVPNPDTLYRPPEPTNATDLSTSSETQDTPTPTVPTTPHLALCDVCSRDDLECVRGGRPTVCDPDRPYCQVTVYEDNRFTQYAERSCADLNTCMKDWTNHTSGRPYCLEVDKGPLFYPNYCSFCCVGDQCNNGSLVPNSETLYYPMASPSTPLPISTANTDITETTSDETQTTLDVTQTSTESTTIHYPICDTCSADDPNCMTGGQPTTCDLDTPFCMTSVIEDMTSTQTARRMCVNETVCQVEWLQKTSSKYYCYKVDQGPLYFANTCSFCCRGELCNSGTLVPDTHKLYVLPPTTGPTSTHMTFMTP